MQFFLYNYSVIQVAVCCFTQAQYGPAFALLLTAIDLTYVSINARNCINNCKQLLLFNQIGLVYMYFTFSSCKLILNVQAISMCFIEIH